MAISRGQDVQLRIFKASTGAVVRVINASSFTMNEDATVERQKRLGTRDKPTRYTIDGHSGTATFEEEDPTLDDLLDEQIEAYRNGDPDYKVEFFVSTYYPKTGTRQSYVYPGVAFTINTEVSDQDSPVTKTINWTSELRRKV